MDEYIDRAEAIKRIRKEALLDYESTELFGLMLAISRLTAIPPADVVPWDWLYKYAEGKRPNYASDFIIEAKAVFYRELVKETGWQ